MNWPDLVAYYEEALEFEKRRDQKLIKVMIMVPKKR